MEGNNMSKRCSLFLLCLIVALSAGYSPIQGENKVYAEVIESAFYISPDGDNMNDGSINAPFLTPQRAQQAIRDLKLQEGFPVGGVNVYLREGDYVLSESWLLEQQDSGTVNAPIVYQSYPGEEVSIKGGF